MVGNMVADMSCFNSMSELSRGLVYWAQTFFVPKLTYPICVSSKLFEFSYIDMASGGENDAPINGLWLRSALKKYFGFGVSTSDPLLNAIKWIAYGSEVTFFMI